ncbi:MAG: hypothetical protein NTZ59_04745 [Bacteroidetes bacterium]|nr:hypothetical protein [Bacteroidota bacterium]
MKKLIYTICLLLTGWQLQAQINTLDIYPGEKGSQPDGYTSYKGYVYFSANNPTYGRELWKTDGTAAGTSLVKDIYAGVLGSNPKDLFVANNILYFTANNGVLGNELWMTDGTITKLAKDFVAGSGSSNAKVAIEFNGKILVSYDSANTTRTSALDGSYYLNTDWGTSVGTIQVVLSFVKANNKLFYAGSNNVGDVELYSWDGTNTPQLVANINATGSSSPMSFLQLNDTLYYSADDGVHGRELFATNVNNGATKIVKDYNVGSGSSFAKPISVINNNLISIIQNNTLQASGVTTVNIIDVASAGPVDFYLEIEGIKGEYSIRKYNNNYYFPAFDNSKGNELFKWDGTNPPTLAIDYNTGTASSNPSDLFVYKDHLFFNATDATGKTNLVMYNGNTWGNVKDSASINSFAFVDIIGDPIFIVPLPTALSIVIVGPPQFINPLPTALLVKVKDTSGNEEPSPFAKLQVCQEPIFFEINVFDTSTSRVIIQGSTDSLNVVTAWNSNSNNTFTAQLSNKDGSFANPTNIGTMSSNKGGKMAVRYPTNIPQSENYRVRIVASSPADTSLPSNQKLALIPASFINSCNNINPTVDSLYGGYLVTYTYWQIDSLGLPVNSFAPVTVNDTLLFAPDATNAEMMTIKSLNKTSGIINISQMSYNTEMLQLTLEDLGIKSYFKLGKKLPAITHNSTYAHISTSPTSGLPYNPPYELVPVDLNPFGFQFNSQGIPNLISGPIQLPGRGHFIIQPKRNIGTYAGNRYELQVRGSNRAWYAASCGCWYR